MNLLRNLLFQKQLHIYHLLDSVGILPWVGFSLRLNGHMWPAACLGNELILMVRWAAIVTTTIAARVALLPVFIKQQKVAAQLQDLKPELDPIQAELKRLKSVGDTVGAKIQAQKLGQFFLQKKVNPLAGLVGLVQIPVFISFFMGVRSMAEAGIPGFKTGGIGIFSDLSACDPTYILPAISSGGMILMMKVNELSGNAQMQSEIIKKVMWTMSIVGLGFMSFMPIVTTAH